MIFNSVPNDHIRTIKATKVIDEWNRPFYKVRVYCLQERDIKTFRDKQRAQDYMDEITEKVAKEGADHIVIISEM